jgi:hypothetical protein
MGYHSAALFYDYTMIKVVCPRDGEVYHADPVHIGKRIKCRRCGDLLDILSEGEPIVRQTSGAGKIRHPRAQSKPVSVDPRRYKTTFFWALAALVIVAFGTFLSYRQSRTTPLGEAQPRKAADSGIYAQTREDNLTPIAAEKKTDFAVTDPFEVVGEEPLRTQPNPPGRNIGVDIALPRMAGVELRMQPGRNSAVVLSLTPTDLLALVHRASTSGWYDVIHVNSGKEGWVAKEDVRLELSNSRRREPRISETYVGGNEAPTILVLNDTNRDLNLKVTKTSYKIAAGSRETLAITEGETSFEAWVPDAFPVSGTKNWKRSYKYEWRFFIRNGLF